MSQKQGLGASEVVVVHFLPGVPKGTIDLMAYQDTNPFVLTPLDDREQGFWCPVEIRILSERFSHCSVTELSDDWLPFQTPETILAKAAELGLRSSAGAGPDIDSRQGALKGAKG